MPKTKTVFVCNECGYESPKWLGKCPACNEWNTFYEEKLVKSSQSSKAVVKQAKPIKLNNVEIEKMVRTSTGFEELDRVLGGGLVKGSLVLLRWGTRNREINTYTSNMR